MSRNIPQLPRLVMRAILVRNPQKRDERIAARALAEQRVPVLRALSVPVNA